MINFSAKQTPVLNAIDGRQYQLRAFDLLSPSETQMQQIATLCNEDVIYQWLFNERLSGKPYSVECALQWWNWAVDGWNKNTHFVFGILDAAGNLVGSCDIKNADPNSAEIGYWAGSAERGIVTNSIIRMLSIGKEAGFRRYIASIHKNNAKSQAVAIRAGFQIGMQPSGNPNYVLYEHTKFSAA